MNAREVLPLLGKLCEVTEAQIAAARTLDGASLHELNSRRSDIAFELKILLNSPFSEDDPDRSDLAREVRRLRKLEARLSRIAGTVIDTLDSVSLSGPARTYGRSGRIQG